MADVCCAAGAPVSFEYAPKGKVETLAGDLEAYVAEGTKPAAILVVYDIFGYSDFPQIKQVSDRLAAATGFTVAVPDVFRGKPWSMSKFPPKPEDNLLGWISAEGAYDKVSKDLYAAVEALNARGCRKFAVLGCCWGASISLQAGADAATFSAVAGLHPSLFGRDADLAAGLKVPAAVVSAKGDPLESVQEGVAKASPALAARCVWRRMDDMTHGFCAARGDFRDPSVCARVGEVLQLLTSFFAANLA
ncbi:hypothetical protein Rsub_06713 [Raphidocelis subcapitata]|uniref:Dienelactone hydrolase domain-containing protein n=1 Tax=Raphidocelis subcapitata TaxID=307507 RepID=A0A2V0P415_9CHLO|nr:hypothetical protein Rsub_06713 [Raphidocelis subcapitata]|eukprot:GBF94598.1 hypothetical protein Rsub_06713 [Raphidocelis subcapitata]